MASAQCSAKKTMKHISHKIILALAFLMVSCGSVQDSQNAKAKCPKHNVLLEKKIFVNATEFEKNNDFPFPGLK